MSAPTLVVFVNSHVLSRATSSSPLCYTVLLFGDEVKYIWARQRSLFSLFWFLVRWLRDSLVTGAHESALCRAQLRYPIILSHVFVVTAYASHDWSPQVRLNSPSRICLLTVPTVVRLSPY